MSVTENASARGGVSVTRRCEVCDSRLSRRRIRFCSDACERANRQTTGRCEVCAIPLIRKRDSRLLGNWVQHYRRGSRYCSNACRQKAYRARNGGAA